MKILIISGMGCDDSEIQYPLYRLLEEGYEVDVATKDGQDVIAKHYVKIPANKVIDEVKPEEYDALMLPGGSAPEKLRQMPSVIDIVKYFVNACKPIASICHGQQILISAKVIDNRKITCYPGIKDDVINAGANYVNEPVVVDGNFVTSRRPEDLPYFMREYIKLLNKEEQNDKHIKRTR